MYKRILLRLAPIQLLLLMAVSCTPEATAPLFDSDVESTANHKGDDGDSYAKTKGLIAEIDDEGMRVRIGDDWFWDLEFILTDAGSDRRISEGFNVEAASTEPPPIKAWINEGNHET